MKDLTLLVDEFMEACNCEATIDETAYHFYELGYKECREQMLKEAVEGVVCYGSKGAYVESDFLGTYDTEVYGKPGDKVRVIVIPNTDEK